MQLFFSITSSVLNTHSETVRCANYSEQTELSRQLGSKLFCVNPSFLKTILFLDIKEAGYANKQLLRIFLFVFPLNFLYSFFSDCGSLEKYSHENLAFLSFLFHSSIMIQYSFRKKSCPHVHFGC